MDVRKSPVFPRASLVLECAPVGKFHRQVHEFATRRHLPKAFTVWGLLSVGIGGFFMTFLYDLLGHLTKVVESGNVGFVIPIVLLILLLPLLKLLSKPTHLCLREDGVFNEWRHSLTYSGRVLEWTEILKISVLTPENTSRIQSRYVCFTGQNNRKIMLKVDEVTDMRKLPSLYEEIIRYAPNTPRDPQLQSILGADRSDASYTELWLKALTAPPERSRLVPLDAGTRLQDGKYVIADRIGAGGQGVAYSATADGGGAESTVVLKEYVLPVGVGQGSKLDSLEKFQAEARILSKIDHAQIVKLLDFFFEDHRAYMVLEFAEGQTLHSLVSNEGAMQEAEILKIAKQMAEMLLYLHSREPEVIHRDFTPDNLILGSGGILKLIDFNVAQEKKSSATSTVVGKHSYISPDQFRGKASAQSDIYSLGASLFYLATGTEPKPISTSRPKSKNDSLSQEFDEIVARCTATDTKLRFASAGELKQAIELLIASKPDSEPILDSVNALGA